MYHVEYATTNALARVEELTGLTFNEAIAVVAKDGDREVALGFLAAGLGDDPLAGSREALEAVLDDIGGIRVLQAAALALGVRA